MGITLILYLKSVIDDYNNIDRNRFLKQLNGNSWYEITVLSLMQSYYGHYK